MLRKELHESINDQDIYWASCQKDGLNPKEKSNLENWLKQEEHKKAYKRAQNTFNIFQNIPKNYSKDLRNKTHQSVKRRKFIQNIKPLLSYAAVLFVVIFTAFKNYDYFIPNYENTYISYKQSIKNITLPDNSRISIDAKTSLLIKYYANKREVVLNKGQAVFTVSKNKNKPFIIRSGKTYIEVVGTKFEVQKEKNITKISVIEGIVKIGNIYNENKDPKILTLLNKGESIILHNSAKVDYIGSIDINTIANWQDDLLIFNNSTLENDFNIFSKYYDIDVELKGTTSQLLFSGKFDTKGLDKFLNAIEKVYSLQIKRNNNKITVLKNNNI